MPSRSAPHEAADSRSIAHRGFTVREYRYRSHHPGALSLNQAEAQDCRILVAGRNFGCGSSREHAPWALLDYGIEAVISSEIADIFRSNSLKNGLLTIVIDENEHRALLANPGIELVIDIAEGSISKPDGSVIPFNLDRFARHCLLNGVDQLGFLLDAETEISAWETRRANNPYAMENAA